MMTLDTLEQFLLLAQHPNKGRFNISSLHIQYGLSGAILLEMSKMDAISISKKKLLLKSGMQFDHPMLKYAADLMYRSKKERSIRYWINKLSRSAKKTKGYVIDLLVKKRLISCENKKFLALFPYKKTFLIENRTRNTLILKLKKAILSDQKIEQEDIMILGLVEACKMHKIFANDKRELKSLQKSLKKIIQESPIASTVNQTIVEVQAAILTTIIASTVVTTSVGSH